MKVGAWLSRDTVVEPDERVRFAEVLVDEVSIRRFESEYRDWERLRHLPVSGTASWLFADLDERESSDVRLVVCRNATGLLRGMLMLVRPGGEANSVWTLAGTDEDARGVLAVDSPETAEELAHAVAQFARDSGDHMNVVLGPLSSADPAVHALASALPGGRVVADTPIPVLDAGATTSNDYLSRGMRRTLRKAFNRLASDGHHMKVSFTTDVGEISDLLPVLAACHRDRDHVHGRQSDLDDARGRRVWERRLMGLALRGRVELAILTINDEFAAHTLGAHDPGVFRVLEGRFVTSWARYSPGRLLESIVIDRVMRGGQMVDWMSSIAPESLIATNRSEPMVRVHWNSHPTMPVVAS